MAASGCRYFEEDAVYRLTKRGDLVFGLVVENGEFASSDDDDQDEATAAGDGEKNGGKRNKEDDGEEWKMVRKGHVRVAWHPRGMEEILAERKVYLADRSLMPGDVVRQVIKGRDTQRGYCRNVKVLSSVQVVGSQQVIYNVDSKNLTPLDEFSPDIAVFLDSWVGMVRTVRSKIHVRCPDGSRCVLSNEDACNLYDITDKRDRFSEFRKYDFYPGQQLKGKASCFNAGEWLHVTDEMKSLKNKATNSIRATVEKVKVVELCVHWQCRAYSKDGPFMGEMQQPKYLIQGDDLTRVQMLNVFEPCTLQLGDRNYYTVKDSDLILNKEHWRRLQRETIHDSKVLPCSKSLVDIPPCVITAANMTESIEDSVTNKDGFNKISVKTDNMQIERNESADINDSEFEDVEDEDANSIDTASLSSRSSVSSASQVKRVKNRPALVTKVLKNKKLKRAKRRTPQELLQVKPGEVVIVETLSTQSSAEVVWQNGSIEKDIRSTTLYPIHHLDDQEFFPGDLVVENRDLHNPHEYGVVKLVDHSGRTALVTWLKTYTEGAEPHPVFLKEEEVSVYDLRDHPDFKYRPGSVVIRVANFENEDPHCTAGQVLDVHPTGMVEVSWVNSHRSFCYPQDLYKVGEYDSEEGELWDDGGESEDSWETESELSIIEEMQTEVPTAQSVGNLRDKLATNIERARASMARLEEIFTQNPALQTTNTMKQLLLVYKDCKYLDQLMATNYFHEGNFQGLLEKVRDRGRANKAQRVAEQVSRLFKVIPDQSSTELQPTITPSLSPHDYTDGHDPNNEYDKSHDTTELTPDTNKKSLLDTDGKLESFHAESTESGISSISDASPSSSVQQPMVADVPCTPTAIVDLDSRASNMCARLCSMLKIQLLKAHEDVMKRFAAPVINEETDSLPPSAPSTPKKVSPSGAAVQTDEKKINLDITAMSVDIVDDDIQSVSIITGVFSMMDNVPDCHKFKLSMYQPTDPKIFFRAVRKETKLLSTSLPEGIIVKGFDDRMDLFSVLIKGPARTPYEDGLFLFDAQLSTDYPNAPPVFHYISYCSDRLNPNLYEDGKVCVSLLGTWGGKGTEVWTGASNLLQVIVSIQGLILVSEPYFNEAGYERQKGTQQGKENSRMYNEMVILKLVQATSKLLLTPPEVFSQEIHEHFKNNGYKFIRRLEKWLEISETYNGAHPTSPTTPTAFREVHGEVLSKLVDVYLPEFPLIPASKGFCLTLRKTLANFKDVLASVDIHESLPT